MLPPLNGRLGAICRVRTAFANFLHCLFCIYLPLLPWQKWDFSRRKVVSYDDTFRDNIDQVGGHGSHVAGSMVGNRMDGKVGIGQGIAPDAKLHVFDLKPGNGGMSDPGAARLFASIYNNGNGAKVHNGSWGRSGRPYSSHCQDWDGSLSGKYEDLLYVSSAGNTGGGARTLKNPADCKNTITVVSQCTCMTCRC